MKSVFVAVVFAALVALSCSQKCEKSQIACQGVDGKCVGDFITMDKACVGTAQCCKYPFHCINGLCKEDSTGMACKEASDCKASLYSTEVFACINGACVIQGNFNDSCGNETHCAGDMTCKDDLCQGVAKGGKCTAPFALAGDKTNFQCAAGLVCIGGTCQEAVALGGECTTSEECDVYSICNNGKCIEPWSLAEEVPCTDSDACGKGLYCDPEKNRCKLGFGEQMIVCTKDKDCADYGLNSTCSMCDAEKGVTYCSAPLNAAVSCAAELAAAYKCYRAHGCAPKPSSSLDTCSQLECTAVTNALFACKSRCESMKTVFSKKCIAPTMLRYCPLMATWLRIVIAFSILVVIIAIVFISYAVLRCVQARKTGYTQINA